MKIQQLKYFIEVCKCGTISKAASNLYVSQPLVTKEIKLLESELDMVLFKRVQNKLYITKEGEYLLSKSISLVNEFSNLKNDLKLFKSDLKCIKIGLPVQVGAFLTPVILKEFCEIYPQIKIDIIELGSYELLNVLENGEIDMIIMSENIDMKNIFKFEYLFTSEYYLIVSNKNPLAECNEISINELGNQKLILLNNGYYVTRVILKEFSNNNIIPNIVTRTSQLHTIKSIVEQDIAASFVLKESICTHYDIKKIPIHPKISVPIGIVTNENTNESEEVLLLKNFLINKFNDINN